MYSQPTTPPNLSKSCESLGILAGKLSTAPWRSKKTANRKKLKGIFKLRRNMSSFFLLYVLTSPTTYYVVVMTTFNQTNLDFEINLHAKNI